MEEITALINTEYLTLGQLLKLADLISSGGMAKWYLNEHQVLVNQVEENRRGRKLYSNDQVEIPEEGILITVVYSDED